MITKAQLLKKTPVFLNNFGDAQNVYNEFQSYKWDGSPYDILPTNLKILYADYTYEDYSGDAYVLGYDKEKEMFFEVHGSHCSCYELEDQWEPEYCSYVELKELVTKRFEKKKAQSYYYRGAMTSESLAMFLEVKV